MRKDWVLVAFVAGILLGEITAEWVLGIAQMIPFEVYVGLVILIWIIHFKYYAK